MKTIRSKKKHLVALALALSLPLLGACAGAELEPAPAAQKANGDAARASIQQVQVVADPGEWPGRYEISEAVTPMLVRIENDSSFPVRVRYSELKLITPDGRTLMALPPFRVEGTVQDPVVAPGAYDPIATPAYPWQGFAVAPYYAGIYTGVSPWGTAFGHDPLYHDAAYRHWTRTRLPTEAMLERALPEGVVRPGGTVEGFVYFEDLDLEEGERVLLRFDIVDAESHREVATAEIPFVAEDVAP